MLLFYAAAFRPTLQWSVASKAFLTKPFVACCTYPLGLLSWYLLSRLPLPRVYQFETNPWPLALIPTVLTCARVRVVHQSLERCSRNGFPLAAFPALLHCLPCPWSYRLLSAIMFKCHHRAPQWLRDRAGTGTRGERILYGHDLAPLNPKTLGNARLELMKHLAPSRKGSPGVRGFTQESSQQLCEVELLPSPLCISRP